uniref:Rho guanine nucleotide exchange factor 16 n=1 Tax=Ailuropoda melanoleuca TaxID=9646 RepID=A0A7N5KKC5_AILME
MSTGPHREVGGRGLPRRGAAPSGCEGQGAEGAGAQPARALPPCQPPASVDSRGPGVGEEAGSKPPSPERRAAMSRSRRQYGKEGHGGCPEPESQRPHLGGWALGSQHPGLSAQPRNSPTQDGPCGSDSSAQPWSEGATFCTGTPPQCWAGPGAAMGTSQPEGSVLWGALRRLMLSGPPWEDLACRFPGGHTCSEPPGVQVTPPLSPDPGFYQEIRERGLNTSHESDDDLLGEPSSPEGTGKVDTPIVVKSYRPAQITWSQLPEVVESGLLDELPAEERKRQEAIFEILTSEFSYQHSLGILVAEFLQSRELRATMTQTEHHHLFSNIRDVLSASQRFFEALEQRHKAQVCVEDISDILEEHAEKHFHPYIAYCSNEVYQQRVLQKLTNSNAAFHEALKEIEKRPACGGLPMISFLILPMQRVTRLPLLTDTLCLKSQGHPERYKAASRALKAISKLVRRCNEGAHKMERTELMYTLHTQLDFGKVKSLPLISASRWLLKRGELFVVEETGLFRKLASRPTCYLFLFNDVLVVTKKKSEDSFMVQDYAQVDHIRVQKMEPSDPSLLGAGGGSRSSSVPHPFQVTLLHNSEGRQEKILLSSDSASDRARWITALTHQERQGQGPTNKGDLLQVEITRAYLAKQADEISLQQADVVLVLEQEDGWLYGERLRDGEMGWFPEDFARCITSRMAVEGNVRRMERLRVETDV